MDKETLIKLKEEVELAESMERETTAFKKIKLSEDLDQIIDNTGTLYTGKVLYCVVTGSLRHAVMEAMANLKSSKNKDIIHGVIKYEGFEVEFRREDRWQDVLDLVVAVSDFKESFDRRNNNNASI